MLTEKQKENRKTGIGASEAAIVMGQSPYCTPYRLWMIKTGKIEEEDIGNKPEIWWGNALEDPIAKRYEILRNVKLRKDNRTLRHPKYPHILCHLDRRIPRTQRFVEIKTSNIFSYLNQFEWGNEGTDQVPEAYVWQIQHQLAITGFEDSDLVVYPKGAPDIKIYTIKRDEALIELLIKKINHFWECVKNNEALDLSNRSDVELAFPVNNGNMVEADQEVLFHVEQLQKLKHQAKLLEGDRGRLEDELTLFIKDNDGIVHDGEVIATWKANKKGTRVLTVKNGGNLS